MGTWDETATVLVERAEPGWSGIWSLTYAAGRVIAAWGATAPMADTVELTYAAMDLCEAREELQWARPDLPARCPAVVVDPGDPLDADAARNALTRLVTAALTQAEALLGDDLDTTDLTCLARAAAKLHSARCTITALPRRPATDRGRP